MEAIMDEREQFEAWVSASGRGHMLERETPHGWYLDLTVTAWWTAWQESRRVAVENAIKIVESHQVPVGNSAAGEMACEWTMDALREIRAAIRALTQHTGEKS